MNNTKKLLCIVVAVLLVIFIGLKLFSQKTEDKNTEISVTGISFDCDYKKDGDRYVFMEDDEIELSISLDSNDSKNIDFDNISYSIDNTDICNYSTRSNKNSCILHFLNEGVITFKVYYEGKEIYSVVIEFIKNENEEDSDNDIEELENNEEDLNNDKETSDYIDIENISMRVKTSSNVISFPDGSYVVPKYQKGKFEIILNNNNVDYSKLSYEKLADNGASIFKKNNVLEVYGDASDFHMVIKILYDGQEVGFYLMIGIWDNETIEENTKNYD